MLDPRWFDPVPRRRAGSPLRTWLRRERARENAEFAVSLPPGEAPPLHLKPGFLPNPAALRVGLRMPPSIFTGHGRIDWAQLDIREDRLDPEQDGDVTAHPRPWADR